MSGAAGVRPLGVRALDAMSAEDALALFLECGGAPRWAAGMAARRPFRSRAKARATADELWRTLGPDDFRAAFARHPRIGESTSAETQSATGRDWSAAEQSGAATASAQIHAEFAKANTAYEARFGHIYIVSATGRSADELLAMARARMAHDPAREIEVAGRELREIMLVRLEKVLSQPRGKVV